MLKSLDFLALYLLFYSLLSGWGRTSGKWMWDGWTGRGGVDGIWKGHFYIEGFPTEFILLTHVGHNDVTFFFAMH